jgi:phospholipase C
MADGPGDASPFERGATTIKQPYVELDRWLVPQLAALGATPAFVFAEDESVQRAGGEPALSNKQIAAWLRSALDRGLIEPHGIDLGGKPVIPPRWYLSDAGRDRLDTVRPFSDKLPLGFLRRIWARVFGRRLPTWAAIVTAIGEMDPHWDEDWRPPKDPAPISVAMEVDSDEEAQALLNKRIDHIVVLMLENRSFDHMLGYLRLQGQSNVEGLTGGPEQVNHYKGETFRPKRFGTYRIPKSQDPCHSYACVHDQIENENGFVENFAERVDPDEPGLVMGFYTGDQLPVYDYIAHNFCICDRWHSSVAGSTWLNRLYALTGRADLAREGIFDGPLWDFPSFAQHLDQAGVAWRWYSHDPAILRAADGQYRKPDHDFRRDNFRFYDRKTVGGFTQEAEEWLVEERDCFFDDARTGGLAPVSWIDPNFVDLSFLERNSNDDHPPSDVRAGQSLVLRTLRALVESPRSQFERTLFIVTYDEHGGFYDHVSPPEAEDDNPDFRRYGVRVPAFVVSPWVGSGTVSKTLFDHTSIIKTILQRFAPDAAPAMGTRVAKAESLGRLLTRSEPASVPDYRSVVQAIANWSGNLAGQGIATTPVPDDYAGPPALHGFQAEVLKAAQLLRGGGLPPGQP